MIYDVDLARIHVARIGSRFSFDGDSDDFWLAAETRRMRTAYLFDPHKALGTSDVRPLPHQLRAVYKELLPRHPLRYVLADDPGAGKTIMAGLYIKELILRGDASNVLVVAPGSLVAVARTAARRSRHSGTCRSASFSSRLTPRARV